MHLRRTHTVVKENIISLHLFGITFGYFQVCFGSSSVSLMCAARLENYSNTSSMMQAVFLTIGALLSGTLMACGRTINVYLMDVTLIIFAILALFLTPTTLLISRIGLDLVRGASLLVYLKYFKEMLPKKYAGLAVGLLQSCQLLAQWVLYLIEYIAYRYGYVLNEAPPEGNKTGFGVRAIFFTAFLLALVHFAGTYILMSYDTPRFLLESKGEEQAYAIISLLYGQSSGANDEMEFLKSTQQYREQKAMPWSEVCAYKNRYALFVCCILMLLRVLSGFFSPFFYSEVFQTSGNYYTLITYPIDILGTILISHFLISLNHRRIVLIGLFISSIALIASYCISLMGPKDSPPPSAIIASFVAHTACVICVGPVAWLLSVHLLSDKSLGIATTVFWVSQCAIYFPFYLKTNNESSDWQPLLYMFPVFITAAILGVVFSLISLKGISSTEEKELVEAYIRDDSDD